MLDGPHELSIRGYSLEVGYDVINLPTFVKTLLKVCSIGVCSPEHENDLADPFIRIVESISYYIGVIKATK
jgi:inosose dehydratase